MTESARTAAIIDTHVHLNEIEHVTEVLARARAKSVGAMVAMGMDLASNRATLEYARRFRGLVYPAIGYHPWSIRAEEIDATLEFLDQHLEGCVAVGEIGLDYRAKIKKPVQRHVFSEVLALAVQKDLPVVVHSRYSHERTHRMVRDAGVARAVFHWYSGSLEVLEKIIADGYLISATPALAYSEPHRAALTRAPVKQVLVETDAPVNYGGQVSEPADVVTTLKHLARIKRVPEAELIRITTGNARCFFGIR